MATADTAPKHGPDARRAFTTLLVNEALLNVGFYLLIPLISVHFTQNVGLSASAVGFVLAVRPLVQQVPGIFSGMLADRIGYRVAITLGLLIRMVGFIVVAFADDLPLLLIGTIIFGLGGSLIWANGRAAMAAVSPIETLASRYAFANTLENAIAALGPLAGTLLLAFDFAYVSLTGAACMLVAAILTLTLLPPIQVAGTDAPGLLATLRIVWRDRPFIVFTLIMSGHWFLFGQLLITVPLQAVLVTGNTETIGLIYAVNSATLIAFTYLAVRWVSRVLAPLTILPIGLVLMGLGLGSYAFAAGLPILLGGIAVYAIGWMLAEPMRQTVNAQIAPPQVRAAYFGFSMLSVGFGVSASQFLGGWLFDVGQALDRPAIPWFVALGVGLGAALALVIFRQTAGRRWNTAPA